MSDVTVRPTRDQLRALVRDVLDGGSYLTDEEEIAMARGVRQLLDQLAAAEQRIRDLTQEVKDERGAALDLIEQVKIRDARIKAVEDVLDRHSHYGLVEAADIRRALDA